MRNSKLALSLALAAVPLSPLIAQSGPITTSGSTRLDVVATGEVTRVPDVAQVSAGVITTAATATAAIEQNGRQMASVRQALKRAGIADKDIQTSAINLYPDYRHDERGGNPQLIGYRASNEVTIRFRDIGNTGKILDALVAEGANQINGPMLSIDKPEAAMDEARLAALNTARSRAELYARAAGKRVGKMILISESGNFGAVPMARMVAQSASRDAAATKIDPGEQAVSVTLSVSFELE